MISKHTNLLDIFAMRGAAYLHPGGKKLTAYAFNQLHLASGMQILEVGCGTAATLADLALYEGVHLTGVDISTEMLRTATERLAYCGLAEKVSLRQIKADGKLPFADDSFDIAYAESVLAIADELTLPILLKEITRVLKPGGFLLSNDAIWKDGTSAEHIAKINRQCLVDFGIIQSLANPATPMAWQQALKQAGLQNIKATHILPDALTLDNTYKINSASERFTRLKQRKAWLNPVLLVRQIKAAVTIKMKHAADGENLATYLFVAQKPK